MENRFKSFTKGKNGNLNLRKNAVIYTRVSSKEQEENTSLEFQLKGCLGLSKRENLTVLKQFGGTYESAKTDERKQFKLMIDFVKKNNIKYIIVQKYDRFSRSGPNAAYLAQQLRELGILIVSVEEKIDLEDPSGILMQNIYFSFSNYENNQRSKRTSSGMSSVLRKGYWPFPVPRGYSSIKGENSFNRNIYVNEEGKLLKLAFDWKSNGMSSVDIISKLLNLGMKVNEKRLSEIFRNPFYCGVLVSTLTPNESHMGIHEPIVSPEIFIQINSRLNNGTHPTFHNTDNEELPLKRFAYCSECNTPLTGFIVKKKDLYYYKCRKKGCSGSRSAKKLEILFEELLSLFTLHPSLLRTAEQVMTYKHQELRDSNKSEIKRLERELAALEEKLMKVEEKYIQDDISKEIYMKHIVKCESQIMKINNKLMRLSKFSSNFSQCIKKAIRISTDLSKMWSSGDLALKKRIQLLVFPEGIIHNKELNKVQTKRVNLIFAPIAEIKRILHKNNSGDSINFDQISALVTSAGFKPATLRAEI